MNWKQTPLYVTLGLALGVSIILLIVWSRVGQLDRQVQGNARLLSQTMTEKDQLRFQVELLKCSSDQWQVTPFVDENGYRVAIGWKDTKATLDQSVKTAEALWLRFQKETVDTALRRAGVDPSDVKCTLTVVSFSTGNLSCAQAEVAGGRLKWTFTR